MHTQQRERDRERDPEGGRGDGRKMVEGDRSEGGKDWKAGR